MRLALLLNLLFLVIITSCHKEPNYNLNKTQILTFSTDTVLFDTVFTTIGSTSKRLKVYNPTNKPVRISEIKLNGGKSSAYQLNINGQYIDQSHDLELSARDSLTIFVKVNINPTNNSLPFIVSDSLSFVTNGYKQTVNLLAYGQNAVFFNEKVISHDTIWDNKLPFVIYNSVIVNENVKLVIKQGTRIYFHKDSKFLISGSLNIEGIKTDTVSFSSDRLETIYEDEPGQWSGIHFLKTSKDNRIEYATIKNAAIGIQVDSASSNHNPKLILSNSIIKYMAIAGIVLYNSNAHIFNSLFYNCGKHLLYGALGGNYIIKQNTFAAYNFHTSHQTPAVYLSDNLAVNNSTKTALLNVNLVNNIITGNLAEELVLDKKGGAEIILNLQNNLLKTKNTTFNINGNLINLDPLFTNSKDGNFKLIKTSPAANKGVNLSADDYYQRYLSKDIKGNIRVFPSELGCYEN